MCRDHLFVLLWRRRNVMQRRGMLLMVGRRQQEAAFEGKSSPEALVWPLMKWKVFTPCQKFISIRDVASRGGHLLFLGSDTAPVASSHGSRACLPMLSLQHLFLPSFLCRSRGRIHYGVTISPSCFPFSSAPWRTLCFWVLTRAVSAAETNIFSLP